MLKNHSFNQKLSPSVARKRIFFKIIGLNSFFYLQSLQFFGLDKTTPLDFLSLHLGSKNYLYQTLKESSSLKTFHSFSNSVYLFFSSWKYPSRLLAITLLIKNSLYQSVGPKIDHNSHMVVFLKFKVWSWQGD